MWIYGYIIKLARIQASKGNQRNISSQFSAHVFKSVHVAIAKPRGRRLVNPLPQQSVLTAKFSVYFTFYIARHAQVIFIFLLKHF